MSGLTIQEWLDAHKRVVGTRRVAGNSLVLQAAETERMRYKGERDALRVEVDALAVDKATLQANLTSALGGGALSPRSAAVPSGLSVTSPAMPDVLSTPVKQVVARKWPSSPHPPSQPPFSE